MKRTTGNLARVSLVALCATALVPLSASVSAAETSPSQADAQESVTAQQDYLVELGNGTSVAEMIDRTDVRKRDIEDKQSGPIFTGAVVNLTPAEAQDLANEPGVREVVPDTPVTISGDAATWGQDRSDQRSGRDGSYTPPGDGSGVHVYVIDTGIDLDHPEFAGRIGDGYDATGGDNFDDCNGHGTHVAGTVGSNVYGLAKQATLYPVKALSCDGYGSTSKVIQSLNWIATNAAAKSVVNMSLGGSANSFLDAKVAEVVAQGIPVVAAAGNDTADACSQSPARAAAAITVGASTSSDTVSGFSNYGTCLDLFAPGSSIRSTRVGQTGGVSYSGTSMASPHVAAAVAIYWSVFPGANASQIATGIQEWATTGELSSTPAGSPNRLLYVRFDGSNPPAPEPAPAPDPAPEPAPVPETAEIPMPPPIPDPVQAAPLTDYSPGKVSKKIGKKRAKLSWNAIAAAESYVIKIKQRTRGKTKASFEVPSSSVTLTGLDRKAKYKVKVFGKSGPERSKSSKTKVRTK